MREEVRVYYPFPQPGRQVRLPFPFIRMVSSGADDEVLRYVQLARAEFARLLHALQEIGECGMVGGDGRAHEREGPAVVHCVYAAWGLSLQSLNKGGAT